MRKYFALLTLIPGSLLAENCDFLIAADALQPKIIQGKRYYIVLENQMTKQCIDTQSIADDLQRMDELKTLLLKYKNNSDKLTGDIQKYQTLSKDYELASNQLVELTHKYDLQISLYDQLAGKYDALTQDYNKLVQDYRNLALQSSPSGIKLDIGAGFNNHGEVGGLIGVEVYKFKVWGVVQQGNNAVMVGTNITF
ncbi:hypothetical protein [Neptunicella marina]|uniref:Uncharacterized protein n=1 Tax=Neptunicella marina TaxID=2125989 RepID=A0A8J6M3W6_9ALTE|nr:hypothetical protein [Neptunicella marina]MBC3767512.1 hypothetical protein [Neptunicella marina]